MSPHDQLPSDINPKKLIKALKRLGFAINSKGGKGSHVKVTWKNEKSVTVQRNLHKSARRSLIKEIQGISGVTRDNIREKL